MNPLGLTPRLCRAPDAAVCQGTIPSHLEATGNPREPWGSGDSLQVPLCGTAQGFGGAVSRSQAARSGTGGRSMWTCSGDPHNCSKALELLFTETQWLYRCQAHQSSLVCLLGDGWQGLSLPEKPMQACPSSQAGLFASPQLKSKQATSKEYRVHFAFSLKHYFP